MSWKKISSEEKYRNRFMVITEDKIITDHGDQLTFGIVHKEPAVMVIPWENNQFTLVGQY